jgi:hypothetical protein
MDPKVKSIGILSVATGSYLSYWQEQLNSWIKNQKEVENFTFHLFTDCIAEAEEVRKKYGFIKIKLYEIEALKFPEASAERYNIYSRHNDNYTEDFLVAIDADMLIVKSVSFEDLILGKFAISLVQHPGFYREAKLKFSTQALRNLIYYINKRGHGSWESNRKSKAFVPRRRRRKYVCGGIWFGRNEEFKELVKKLYLLTEIDKSTGEGYPIWHDESYLNKWASENEFNLLSPIYCFSLSYPNLKNLEPVIIAIDK